MSILGASRAAGEIASTEPDRHRRQGAPRSSPCSARSTSSSRCSTSCRCCPLDGGHIAGALYEAVRRRLAALFRRPDPGFVDTAKMLPVAYVVGSLIAVSGVVLILADVIDPIRLFQ